MAKAQIKTAKTAASAEAYLKAITPAERQADCRAIAALMGSITGAKPRMWGPSIVGFGERTLRSASGREVEWFFLGFASRKAEVSLYLSMDIKAHAKQLAKLGRHKTGAGCLYIKTLADVDLKVLEALMRDAMAAAQA